MGDKSGIVWTDATWNPTVGCTKVSAGCDHCYAETLVNRFIGTSSAFPTTFDVVTLRSDRFLTQPLRWAKPRRIFVNSLSDLFHKDIPDDFIARVFAVMAACQQHTFQLLTKRHGRMRALLSEPWLRATVEEFSCDYDKGDGVRFGWPLPNLWLGVSAEDQHTADLRIPALLETPSAVRWVSAEPLLGPINLRSWLHLDEAEDGYPPVDWLVAGGESGAHARPMDTDWARSLRDQCAGAGIPFLFKQYGGRTPKTNGRTLDGRTWDGYPTDETSRVTPDHDIIIDPRRL